MAQKHTMLNDIEKFIAASSTYITTHIIPNYTEHLLSFNPENYSRFEMALLYSIIDIIHQKQIILSENVLSKIIKTCNNRDAGLYYEINNGDAEIILSISKHANISSFLGTVYSTIENTNACKTLKITVFSSTYELYSLKEDITELRKLCKHAHVYVNIYYNSTEELYKYDDYDGKYMIKYPLIENMQNKNYELQIFIKDNIFADKQHKILDNPNFTLISKHKMFLEYIISIAKKLSLCTDANIDVICDGTRVPLLKKQYSLKDMTCTDSVLFNNFNEHVALKTMENGWSHSFLKNNPNYCLVDCVEFSYLFDSNKTVETVCEFIKLLYLANDNRDICAEFKDIETRKNIIIPYLFREDRYGRDEKSYYIKCEITTDETYYSPEKIYKKHLTEINLPKIKDLICLSGYVGLIECTVEAGLFYNIAVLIGNINNKFNATLKKISAALAHIKTKGYDDINTESIKNGLLEYETDIVTHK